jgi:eukaryotic-like serine/threonine-protein kinase
VRAAILGTQVAYAERAWERLGPTLDGYAARWVHVHTETCEATTVRGEQSATVMDAKMACLHRARMDLDATTRLLSGADAAIVSKAHEIVASLPPLSRCQDAVALASDVPPPPEDVRPVVEDVLARLADVRAAVNAGQYARADGKIQGLLDDAAAADYEPVRTEVLIESARWHLQAAHFDEATKVDKEALRAALRWGQWRSARRACEVLIDGVTQARTEFETGFAYAETAWGLSLRDDATELERAELRQSLAALYDSQGRPAEAEVEARAALETLERELSPGDLGVAQSRNILSMVLMGAGQLAEAEQQQRLSLAAFEGALGPRHPTVIVAHNNLAGALAMQGEFAEAELEMRGVLEAWTDSLGPEHPRVAGVHHNLSIALYNLGRLEEAAKESRLAIAGASKVMGPEHATIADMRFGLADILHLQGRHAEAEAEARATLRLREQVLGPEHPDVAYSRDQVGMMLTALGQYEEAEAMHASALASQEKALGAAHPDLVSLRLHMAEAQLRSGAPERAVQTLQRARHVRAPEARASSADARVDFTLARALVASGGDVGQAMELARRAEAVHAALGPEAAAMREEIAAWIREQG